MWRRQLSEVVEVQEDTSTLDGDQSIAFNIIFIVNVTYFFSIIIVIIINVVMVSR